MKKLFAITCALLWGGSAAADLAEAREAVEAADGHAMLIILMPEDLGAMGRIADGLAGAGDVRVGAGVYGGQLPEVVAAREATLQMFRDKGFTVCDQWGTESYDLLPTDIQNAFNKRWSEVFDGAGNAALLIDNGAMTMAGVEYGQDYLLPGAGTSEDRLFVDLEAGASEVRDDQLFSAVDLMIGGESYGQGEALDCMKVR